MARVDALDLRQVSILKSPAVADWPITLGINRLRCTPQGGFLIDFDDVVPARWKWPSSKADPSENFQYTVWMVVQPLTGFAMAAGFVQMWEGRPMGLPTAHALPPLFAIPPGDLVVGWRNWWGDPRKLWGPMSDYVPQPGDTLGLFVTAGNARQTTGVDLDHGLSVKERSAVVLFQALSNDLIDVSYPMSLPDPAPVPTPDPSDGSLEVQLRSFRAALVSLTNQVAEQEMTIDGLVTAVTNQNALLAQLAKKTAPTYTGTIRAPWPIGTVSITLTPQS